MWRRHAHAERAQRWFDKAGSERFFFCRITQMGVLRLLTTERALGSDVRTMAGAWKLWDEITADERIALIGEPEGLERLFRKASRLPSPSPKVWADSYLLGFAEAAGLNLVTFDQALGSRGNRVLIL
jgi:hypothetical protein